jgi:protein-disulfide isomerase
MARGAIRKPYFFFLSEAWPVESIQWGPHMKRSKSIRYTLLSSLIKGAVFSCALIINAGALAQDAGASSAHPDHPPFLDPDIESRSTDPERPPAYGPEDAKVRIVMFSDYQCPACRRARLATHQISAEFPGEVRIELWHRPIPSHRAAETAALAAVAAQRQGQFWEMHDKIFTNKGGLDVPKLEQFAEAMGLDLDQFRADMNDPAVKERVQAENALAEAIAANGTPAFVINGNVKYGWGSWWSFRANVGQELTAANALAEQGLEPLEIQRQRAAENFEDPEKYELYLANVIPENITPSGE